MGTDFRAIVAGSLLAFGGLGARAEAGELVLVNSSDQAITCTVDGWTAASGAAVDVPVEIPANQTYRVGQNGGREPAVIDWAQCGTLRTRMMNISPAGPDGTLILNGQQSRVLNVALYSYIPNIPGATFEALVEHVVRTYQEANPDVLLSAQMNPVAQNSTASIYSFTDLPAQLREGGFDVMEIDTLYLGALARDRLINEVRIMGDEPYPAALAASTVEGRLWGIPSWLCTDFVYATVQDVRNATTMPEMLAFLATRPEGAPKMVGIHNGSWQLPIIYINAYVQAHGYDQLAYATAMPPDDPSKPADEGIDAAAIENVIKITDTCESGGVNNCTNDTYNSSMTPGVTEQVFASGQAGANMGFSEKSFYINHYGPGQELHVTPAVWGNRPQPLLFSDTFVTSSANCQSAHCIVDSTNFTTMMTGAAMKTYIVQSRDLPEGSPWRTLLVATQPFYRQAEIDSHPLYDEYMPVLESGRAFPNDFTAESQNKMKYAICKALKEKRPAYVCKTSG